MMASLRSPQDLCERLGLRPTTYQQEILQRFYDDVDPINEKEIPAERTCNAAALCALWRLLLIPGSRCIVIAANRELESRFMGFMHQITTEIDPALTSMCKWANGKTMKVGDSEGYELRFVSNRPAYLQGIHDGTVTWVILGAKSSETKFCDTMQVVDTYRGREGHRHIVIW
jgi:hypothetical protein